MILPDRTVQPVACHPGDDHFVAYLASRIGIPEPLPEFEEFPAGGMFWVRLGALRPLLDAHLAEWEFESAEELTEWTRAVEAVLRLCVQASGHRTCVPVSQGHDSSPDWLLTTC